MNSGHLAQVPVLRYFYVMNLVVLLLVLFLGGTLVIARVQRQPFHPWANSPHARNVLLIGLGVLWILDGLLQAQPLMVTDFIHELVVPLLLGQPRILVHIMEFGMHLWTAHPLTWDIVAIWVQILIGLCIIFGSDTGLRRFALWVSIVWGLIVWIGGEGLGSLLAGGSWFVGSPGSVILYVIAALALLQPQSVWLTQAFRYGVRKTLAGLWALFALLQAMPGTGWWSTPKLGFDVLAEAQMAQPGFISAPLYRLAYLAVHDPRLWNAIFVGLFFILFVMWGLWRPTRLLWITTVAITVAIWWCGQDLGVFGGMGTDPNTGAILLLGLMVYADLAFVPEKSELDPPHEAQLVSPSA
jgi:hypothetical protein